MPLLIKKIEANSGVGAASRRDVRVQLEPDPHVPVHQSTIQLGASDAIGIVIRIRASVPRNPENRLEAVAHFNVLTDVVTIIVEEEDQ